MSFRASHYFVSYVSEATAVAGGLGYCIDQNNWNGMLVAQPINIEVPRSLVDVVVSWNMLFNRGLRHISFDQRLRNLGHTVAIFTTFVRSVFLHCLNFQLDP